MGEEAYWLPTHAENPIQLSRSLGTLKPPPVYVVWPSTVSLPSLRIAALALRLASLTGTGMYSPERLTPVAPLAPQDLEPGSVEARLYAGFVPSLYPLP